MVRLWKMLENRDIRLIANDKKRGILASEPNYHTSKYI